METEKKKSGGWDLSTPDLQPVLVQRQCLSAGGVRQSAGQPETEQCCRPPEPGASEPGGGRGGDQSRHCSRNTPG